MVTNRAGFWCFWLFETHYKKPVIFVTRKAKFNIMKQENETINFPFKIILNSGKVNEPYFTQKEKIKKLSNLTRSQLKPSALQLLQTQF